MPKKKKLLPRNWTNSIKCATWNSKDFDEIILNQSKINKDDNRWPLVNWRVVIRRLHSGLVRPRDRWVGWLLADFKSPHITAKALDRGDDGGGGGGGVL